MRKVDQSRPPPTARGTLIVAHRYGLPSRAESKRTVIPSGPMDSWRAASSGRANWPVDMEYFGPADAKSTNVPSAAGFSVAPVVKASATNNSDTYRMSKMIPKTTPLRIVHIRRVGVKNVHHALGPAATYLITCVPGGRMRLWSRQANSAVVPGGTVIVKVTPSPFFSHRARISPK